MAPAFPETDSAARSRSLAKRVFGIVVLWRLLYLIPFTAKFDLVGDESYYWDWGRQLDWGYFSKPPMIGWLMGLVGRLSGNTEWGVRLGSLALGSISLWLLYKLADRLFGARTALWALLLGALTPANAGLNLLLTIDAPLVLCWTAALLVFWGLLEKPGNAGRWMLLTVILGLGYLSKQMMLVFPLLMIVFCWFTATARPLLRQPVFWLCIGASLLFMTPVIIWNAQHGWVTVQHTGSHFSVKADATILDHVGMFFGFLGLQALIFTPLTWLILMAAAFGGLKHWKRLNAAERYLVLFSAPALAVFVLLALRQNVNANWPAVYYLGAVVLAAAWIDQKALSFLQWAKLGVWSRRAVWVGAICSVGVYVLLMGIDWVGLAGTKYDPAIRVRGWHEVGQEAQAFFDKTPHPGKTFVVAMGERDHASELAFYMPSHPQVFRYRPANVIESQYEIWPDPGDMGYIGGDALIFRASDDTALPPSLLRGFRGGFEKVGQIHVKLGRRGEERFYQVYLGRDMKFWPGPPSPEELARMQEAQARAEAEKAAANK